MQAGDIIGSKRIIRFLGYKKADGVYTAKRIGGSNSKSYYLTECLHCGEASPVSSVVILDHQHNPDRRCGKCSRSLPSESWDKYRDIYSLVGDGYSLSEIAVMMDCTTSSIHTNVKTMISKFEAYKELPALMEKKDELKRERLKREVAEYRYRNDLASPESAAF